MGLLSTIFRQPAKLRLIRELAKGRLASVPEITRTGAQFEMFKMVDDLGVAPLMGLPEASLLTVVESYKELEPKIGHAAAIIHINAHRGVRQLERGNFSLLEYLVWRCEVEGMDQAPGTDQKWFKSVVVAACDLYGMSLSQFTAKPHFETEIVRAPRPAPKIPVNPNSDGRCAHCGSSLTFPTVAKSVRCPRCRLTFEPGQGRR